MTIMLPKNIKPENLDVWVLAGQSNMQGYGLLCDPALCDAPIADERVLNFSMAGNWEIAVEPLHRLWESYTPVHGNLQRDFAPSEMTNEQLAELERSTRAVGAGLGIPFGTAMANTTGKPVGLIPAAHGGTSLEQWSWELKSKGGASLYGSMLQRIRDAGGKLRGVLWYQGESDAYPGLDATYAARFESWVQALREDVRQPDLAVIAVQLGRVVQSSSDQQAASWNLVREAQRTLPAFLAHTAVAGAIDLGLSDNIHIDTPGLIRLGKRLAHLALALQDGSTPVAPRLIRIERMPDQPNGFGVIRVVCDGVSGGWKTKTHISGFEIYAQDGTSHPSVFAVNANADAREPNVINVIVFVTQPTFDETLFLGYGQGLNPYCNAVDEADRALLAFAPQPIATACD